VPVAFDVTDNPDKRIRSKDRIIERLRFRNCTLLELLPSGNNLGSIQYC